MKSNGFTNKKTRLKFARNDLNKPAQLGEKFFRNQEGKKQLMIQTITQHLSNKMEAALWHRDLCLLVELAFIDHVTADRSSRMNC